MLLDAIEALDDRGRRSDERVAFDLGRLLTGRDAGRVDRRSGPSWNGSRPPATSRSRASLAISP